MKVKAIKLFGDGKRLYSEGEVFEQTKEWVNMINSTPNAPLVEVVEDSSKTEENVEPGKGVDENGSNNRSTAGKGKSRNKK